MVFSRKMRDAKSVSRYILACVAADGGALTPMQLLKLVYICHGWTLGLSGLPLFRDPVEAWRYGPVVPAVYREYRRFGGGTILCPVQQPARGAFSPREQSIIGQVLEKYGSFTGLELSALTHQPGSPWHITRKAGVVHISNDLIEQHYKQLAAAAPPARKWRVESEE